MRNNINLDHFARTYKTSSKAYMNVPYSLDEIIIGNILGDLYVNKRSNNANSRLEFKQSIKNRIYIDHLYSLFENYCSSRPRIETITLKSNPGKEYKSIRFHTLTLPCFNYYWDLFYRFDGNRYKKVVPENLEYLLTPKGLAYWIMDDGTKMSGSNGLVLCTESFTLEEHQLIIQVLEDKFNLDCNIQETSKRNRIYIQSKSREKLLGLVKDYMLPHFYYKLNI